MRLIVSREPPEAQQTAEAASAAINFHVHRPREEAQGAARSLPEAAARSSGFTSAAAAVRSSYDDNDAAGGCIAGGSVVHADAGSNGWWQGQRELAVVGDSQCGAAWGASTAGARRYDRISGDHWHEEDERANSEDEWEAGGRSHGPASRRELTEDELSDLLYKKKGFIVRKMDQDGNCLFRAISDQIYGDSGMHEEVREKCMDYLLAERDHFSNFVTQDFDRYVARKRVDGVFGNNLEMQAMAELYNRPIEVYRSSEEPMKIFHEGYHSGAAPLRLAYHRGNHYNSVRDPREHTVGVGLGLPSDQRVQEEERISEEEFRKTVVASEQDDIEAALLEQALRASWERFEQEEISLQLEQMTVSQSRQAYDDLAFGREGRAAGAGRGSPPCR